jgi:hypothetical protein
MKVPMCGLTRGAFLRCSGWIQVFGARENLKEAVAMVLQASRELAEESLRGAEVLRESPH